MDKNFPNHIAIIMDGNGRWAKKKLLSRIFGHKQGVEVVREIIECSRKIGLKYLTLYAFSTENWDRPKTEVEFIIGLLEEFLLKESNKLIKNNIKFQTIGDTSKFPKKTQEILNSVLSATQNNSAMTLSIALNYGARSEILNATKNIAQDLLANKIQLNDINEELFSTKLYTKNIPDPDILIRTSGEVRISNFLLWQIAYSELFFVETLWPDFTEKEFLNIIDSYQKRDRRFGKVKEE